MKWLYAAYRLEAFGERIPKGLSPEAFTQFVAEQAQTVHQLFVLFAPGHREGQPVGVVSAVLDLNDNLEVHAEWLPWATPRNVLESALKFIVKTGRDLNLMIYAEDGTRDFFEHVSKYGVLKRVGVIDRYFGAGREPDEKSRATLFQSRVV